MAVALPLAWAGTASGGFAMGAAGALLGTSIAEAVALIYMMVDKRIHQPAFDALPQAACPHQPPQAGAGADAHLHPHHHRRVYRAAGRRGGLLYAGQPDERLFAHHAGAHQLWRIYRPGADADQRAHGAGHGHGTNLVPAINAAYERGNYAAVAHDADAGLRVASVIGFPSAIGMSLLAEPILFLLFGRSGKYTPQDLRMGAQLLQISSLTIILFTHVQATSGILQGLHRQRIPMITLAIGVALKVMVNYTLVRLPQVGISGAPYASLICYGVSLAPNLYYVAKYGRMRIRWDEVLLRRARPRC